MKNTILFVFSFALMFSCTSSKSKGYSVYSPLSQADHDQEILHNALDTLFINALNLSEDMSVLSTKNDEIFVFIYDYSDTNELEAPLVSTKLLFDKNRMNHSVSIPKKDKLILFFIEEDSFRTSIQIEPVVRVYFKEVMRSNSYNEVKKYLGEDDLLGVKIINSNISTFSLSGMNSLDKYAYSFVIK